jgi:hypothetical protein
MAFALTLDHRPRSTPGSGNFPPRGNKISMLRKVPQYSSIDVRGHWQAGVRNKE